MNQPMILPKGIVLNSPEIYAEVASYDLVPPEKLWQYWHVYTTTFRRLIDPTAYRLEQFWFRVWGSDRRFLSGKQLAKLFEEFSDGPTFVTLRGPPNRYEGPPRPRQTHPQPGSQARPGPGPRIQSDLDGTRENDRSRRRDWSSPEKAGLKEPTPSSSRPPPAHPILKKPRGPSASGPRPTARFDVPDDEEKTAEKGQDAVVKEKKKKDGIGKGKGKMKEEIKEGIKEEEEEEGEVSSGSTVTNGAEMPPPPRPSQSKSEKKGMPTKAAPAPKKFVASTPTKRRPHIPRRQSSQSSTDSTVGSVGSAHHLGGRRASQTVIMNGERPEYDGSSGSSASQLEMPLLSAKAAGKRPVADKNSESSASQNERPSLGAKAPGKRPMRPPVPATGNGLTQQPPRQERPIIVQQSPVTNLSPKSPSRTRVPLLQAQHEVASRARQEPSRAPPPVAGFIVDQQRGEATQIAPAPTAVPMLRTRSRESTGAGPRTLTATTTVSTSMAQAQTKFESENDFQPTAAMPGIPQLPDAFPPAGQAASSSSSLLDDLRFTPTPPVQNETIPFGRSKSQLTLLLARDRGRVEGQRPPFD